MSKKLVKVLSIVTVCLCMLTIFTGCKEDFYQPTMQQIQTALENIQTKPAVEGATTVSDFVLTTSDVREMNYDNFILLFERKNIVDTNDFTMMDSYYCVGYFETELDYDTERYNMHVFKFSNSESAKDCKDNINLYANFSAKQYGNLVVYSDNKIAGFVFATIDTIKD